MHIHPTLRRPRGEEGEEGAGRTRGSAEVKLHYDPTGIIGVVLARHHDTAARRFTVPQADLPESTCRRPSATPTAHAARQRVQEPHAAGRHQCV